MEAERARAEVVAANMANAETTRTESGGPYRRQHVVFAANQADEDFADSLALPRETALEPAERRPMPPGGVHIAQVIEDSCASAQALRSRAIRTPDRMVTSPIPTLTRSQRWLI